MEKNELTTLDITSLIKKIAIPSSIGLFFNTMYNVVDTFYVGTISTISITALSYSFMVFFMLMSISFGPLHAITALVGNYLGKNKYRMARIYILQALSMMVITAICLSFFGFLYLKELFVLMGAKGESLELALEYTDIILIGVLPMLTGLGANAVLIAHGDTKSHRNILIIGFFLNIILDPLLIYGYGIIPAFGFAGVAYGTVLIQFITAVYILNKLFHLPLFHYNKLGEFFPLLRVYKNYIKQALPSSLNMLMMSLGGILFIYYVSQYGYKTVAAFGIGYRIEQIGLLPMLGLNTAVASIVANNFGAKKIERVFEVRGKALRYGYMMSMIGVICLVVFGKYIVGFFDKDSEVINIAYGYIVISSFSFFGFITIFISNATLQGIKQPFIIPYVSFYRQIFMPAILLYIAVIFYKVDIIFIWIVMLFIAYSSAFFIHFYTSKVVTKYKL